MLLLSSSHARVATEDGSFLYVVPKNNTSMSIENDSSYDAQYIEVLGNVSNAEHAVFQVSEDLPLVTMQKSLSFEDNSYEYALFEVYDTGDTLNIMAIKGSSGISRFVGYVKT